MRLMFTYLIFLLLRHFISFTLPIHSVLTVLTLSFECCPFIQLFPFMTQMQEPICSISVICEGFHWHKNSMLWTLPQECWLVEITTGSIEWWKTAKIEPPQVTWFSLFEFQIFFHLKISDFLFNQNVVLHDWQI